MTGFDPEYVAEVIVWALVWSAVGIAGRQLLPRRRETPRKPPR